MVVSKARFTLFALLVLLCAVAIVVGSTMSSHPVACADGSPVSGAYVVNELSETTFEYHVTFEYETEAVGPESGAVEYELAFALDGQGGASLLQDVSMASDFPEGWSFDGVTVLPGDRQGWLMTYNVEDNDGNPLAESFGFHLYSAESAYESMEYYYSIQYDDESEESGIETMSEAEDSDGDGFADSYEEDRDFDPDDPENHPSRLPWSVRNLIKAQESPPFEGNPPEFTPGDEVCEWDWEIDEDDPMVYEVKKTTDDGQHGGGGTDDWYWQWGGVANGWAAHAHGKVNTWESATKSIEFEMYAKVRIRAWKIGDKCIGYVFSRAYSQLGQSWCKVERSSGALGTGDGSAMAGVARKLDSNIPNVPFDEQVDGAAANFEDGGTLDFGLGNITLSFGAEDEGEDESDGGVPEETEGEKFTKRAWWKMHAKVKATLTGKSGAGFNVNAQGLSGTSDAFVLAQLFCIDQNGAVCSVENVIWESPDPNPPGFQPADPEKQKDPRKEAFRTFDDQHNE